MFPFIRSSIVFTTGCTDGYPGHQHKLSQDQLYPGINKQSPKEEEYEYEEEQWEWEKEVYELEVDNKKEARECK